MSEDQGNDKQPEKKVATNHRMILNKMVGKAVSGLLQNFLNREQFGQSRLDDPKRDLNKECGYPDVLTIDDYQAWYDREGIATRVVDLMPDETWQIIPELYETEDDVQTPFEKAWNELLQTPELNPWHYLHRVDRLSGIGRYAVLFLGIGDGNDLDQPVAGLNDMGLPAPGRPSETPLKLNFMRVFTEQHAKIAVLDTDEKSPRFGKPLMYELTLADVTNAEDSETETPGFDASVVEEDQKHKPTRVHWHRILHTADNRNESELFGTPRLQTVINRCFDLRKILGGSAEMFWKGGFPGYSVEALPDQLTMGDGEELNKEGIAEEFQLFMNGLQRYLAVEGVTIKSLAPQVADPKEHIFQQLLMIAIALGCPLRILIGSEQGQLSGEQEQGRWNSRVARRQQEYVDPMIVRPFIARLMMCRILPSISKFIIAWRDLNAIKETDKADIALKTAQALLQYVTSGSELIMPLKVFIVHVLKWSDDIANAIVKQISDPSYKPITEKLWKEPGNQPPGSGTASSASKTNTNGNAQGQTSRNNT